MGQLPIMERGKPVACHSDWPLFYMNDFSRLGLVVPHLAEALAALRAGGCRLQENERGNSSEVESGTQEAGGAPWGKRGSVAFMGEKRQIGQRERDAPGQGANERSCRQGRHHSSERPTARAGSARAVGDGWPFSPARRAGRGGYHPW